MIPLQKRLLGLGSVESQPDGKLGELPALEPAPPGFGRFLGDRIVCVGILRGQRRELFLSFRGEPGRPLAERLERLPPLGDQAGPGIHPQQVNAEAMLIRPLLPEPLENRDAQLRAAAVVEGPGEVVVEFADRFPHGLCPVVG